ncbi:MAG TPA: hypothetical protein DIU48_13445 [Acidobacteria bacterium]|nr:hypothetical protein [Acidobacteriota bacterium]
MPTNADDLEEALERIRLRVEERRDAGDYPPGLEQQLDRHYHHILKGFDAEVEAITALRLAVANLRAQSEFDLSRIDTWSRNPIKRFLHRVMGKLTIRQTRGVLDQYKRHSDALDEVLAGLLPIVESLAGSETEGGGRERSDLDKRLHTALDRIGLLEERLDRSLAASDDRSV